MKTQWKTAAVLAGTFVLGGVLGFVLHGTFIRSDFRRHVHHMRTPEGFIHRFERVIEPTDAQRKEIRKILRDHFQDMMKHQEQFQARMDSVRQDIDALLTEEQKQRLKHSPLLERKDKYDWRLRKPDRRRSEPFDRPPPPPPFPPDSLVE